MIDAVGIDQNAVPARRNADDLEREIILRLHVVALAIDQLDQFAAYAAQTHEAEFEFHVKWLLICLGE